MLKNLLALIDRCLHLLWHLINTSESATANNGEDGTASNLAIGKVNLGDNAHDGDRRPAIAALSNQNSEAATLDLNTQATNAGVVSVGNLKILGGYSVTKAGNAVSECEDAYAWGEIGASVCFAVADGATESSFAREWATELVQELMQRPIWQTAGTLPALNEWLMPLQRDWFSWLQQQNLVWFAKRKAEQGTFSTLIGLQIDETGQWQAFAVGDSCLFVVREGKLLHSFPLSRSQELGYRPCLIGTIAQKELVKVMQYLTDTTQSGDHFYLVTDALAAWIFKTMELERNPWVQLDRISTQTAFSDWVESLRDCQAIPNDDTTMLHIEVQ